MTKAIRTPEVRRYSLTVSWVGGICDVPSRQRLEEIIFHIPDETSPVARWSPFPKDDASYKKQKRAFFGLPDAVSSNMTSGPNATMSGTARRCS